MNLRAVLHLVCWVLLMLLPCTGARAGNPLDPWQALRRPWFDRVSMADGLPHSITTALAQSRSGVLWIGTMGGLVRYDGYRMQVYELAAHGQNGLPDAYVRCLLALPDGSLLIGTNAGGLVHFDPQTNHFHTYPVGANGTSDDKIYALAADRQHGVWIATDAGLDYLDLGSDRVRRIDTGAQAASRNFTVYQDRGGDVWLGNQGGLFVRFAGHRDFVRPPQADGVANDVLHDQIWAIHEDAQRRLWVGSVQRGAVYREPDGHWLTIPGLSSPAGSQRLATVRDFVEVAPNRLWIATDGDGILGYTPGDPSTQAIDHDISLPSSLPGDAVRALLLDRTGNVWAATDLGVAHSDVRPTVAFSILPSIDATRALSNPNVRSVLVDSRGRIWLGMAAGHIDLIDLATGGIKHLLLGGKQLHRDVQGLAEGPDGSIWVATQGLARINPDTLVVTDNIVPALADTAILSLTRQGDDMLIGSYAGAYRYDTHSQQLIHYDHQDGQPTSLAGSSIHEMVHIGSALWYATGNGISIAHDPLQTSGFVNITRRAGDPTSLPQNLVISLAGDRHGQVWLGTLGGLGLLTDGDRPPYHVRRFGLADGLASDKINAVQPDLDDHVWMSTSNGISVIDGSTLQIRNLGTRDGQHVESYIYAASGRMSDGTLLFGGLGGLTVIRPQHHEPTAGAPAPLRITLAQVNGHVLPYSQLFVDHGVLNLTAHQRNLRLDFALLDFQPPQETAYSYRMEGFDDGWIDVPKSASPSAIYTNLPHGHYVLHLRALPRGLYGKPTDYTLDITVAPLWYETLWARLLAFVLLLAVVSLLVHLRTVYLRRRAQQLQLQIDLHTRELRTANRRLNQLAGTDELTGLNNRRRLLELAEVVRRDGQPACVALLDLDRFKLVNDEYGHLAGDAVLRATAGVICQHLRSGDLAGRYGGEELVLCLPGTTLAQAMEVAERIRTALRDTHVWHDGKDIRITTSIGVAELQPEESMNAWLARADAALYESKHQGRDRCTPAS